MEQIERGQEFNHLDANVGKYNLRQFVDFPIV